MIPRVLAFALLASVASLALPRVAHAQIRGVCVECRQGSTDGTPHASWCSAAGGGGGGGGGGYSGPSAEERAAAVQARYEAYVERQRVVYHENLREAAADLQRWASELHAATTNPGSEALARVQKQVDGIRPVRAATDPTVVDVRGIARSGSVPSGGAPGASPLASQERFFREQANALAVAPPVNWSAANMEPLQAANGRLVVNGRMRGLVIVPPPPPPPPSDAIASAAHDVPEPGLSVRSLLVTLDEQKREVIEATKTRIVDSLPTSIRRIVQAEEAALRGTERLGELMHEVVWTTGRGTVAEQEVVLRKVWGVHEQTVKEMDEALGTSYRVVHQSREETALDVVKKLAPSRWSKEAEVLTKLHFAPDAAKRKEIVTEAARDEAKERFGEAAREAWRKLQEKK